MLIQTWAMIVDAYRELCARKLFWITMGISGFVVLIFAAIGIDGDGVSVLWFDLPFGDGAADFMSKKMFYIGLFQTWGISIWLGIIASVLALITTAGFFPNMLEAGSIEIHLSKPIGRARLFLTRYLTGLLFVALQVAVFTTSCFFVLGIRGGVWIPTVFLAVPIVVVFFSYLFGFCVFVGVLTRSTMPALLLTLLFWFTLYILNVGDVMLVGFREGNTNLVEAQAARVERMERNTRATIIASRAAGGIENYVPTDEDLLAAMPFIASEREKLAEGRKDVAALEVWSGRVFAVKTFFPKTGETVGLLDRWLIPDGQRLEAQMRAEMGLDKEEEPAAGADEAAAADGDPAPGDKDDDDRGKGMDPIAMMHEMRERSVLWIVGTSLAYEAALLAVAGFVFVRRDY